MTKIGFCADWHHKTYRCANCGHEKEESQLSNFYEHKIVDWDNKVCPECGFKSFKPIDLGEELFKNIKLYPPIEGE